MSFESETYYGITPWAELTERTRDWYDPVLMQAYVLRSIYYGMVGSSYNMRDKGAENVYFTTPIEIEPDIEVRDMRGLWLPSLYMDSKKTSISVKSYGSKVTAHKYEEYITRWQEQGNRGLIPMLRRRLGPVLVQTLDRAIFFQYMKNDMYRSFAGSASSFGTLSAGDTFDPTYARTVQLGADYSPILDGNGEFTNDMPCLVSPAAVYSVRSGALSSEFKTTLEYADPKRLLNYEIGAFENVRFAQHPTQTLWGCGAVLAQATITASVVEGAGAPNPATTKVHGWEVGQEGRSASDYYIQLDSITDPGSAETGFKPGDVVVLHRVRNEAEDTTHVLNGVQYDHHANSVRVVHSVDYATNRITLKTPVLTNKFETAISEGVYGYVTKARNVHVAAFMKRPNGVVAAVTQPPQMYILPPIDDRQAIWRFSWDAYIGYNTMYPENFELYFYSGPYRRNGDLAEIVNI